MALALEIAAAVVLLLAIILVAERDDGTAGKFAQVVLVILGIAAMLAALAGLAWWLGLFTAPTDY